MVYVGLVTQLLEVYGSCRVGYTTVRSVYGFPFACYVYAASKYEQISSYLFRFYLLCIIKK